MKRTAVASGTRAAPGRARYAFPVTALLLLALSLSAACGDGDAGLTRAEVEEIVREEMAAAPPPSDPFPAVTRAEVEEIVRAAVASIPPRSAPADYTRFVVESAIARYETQGLEAVLAHYNRPRERGRPVVRLHHRRERHLVIAHPDPERLGLDVKGWVGTDANGYNFGPEMLSATEEGQVGVLRVPEP